MKTNLDLSTIKVQLGGQNEPKDEKLIGLLKRAYKGELLVRIALIKAKAIVPFTYDYRPSISDKFRLYFEEMERDNRMPPLFVYPQADIFVMSDDYSAYYSYLERNCLIIPCVNLNEGKSYSPHVVEQTEAFRLPPPEFVFL